MSKQTREEEKKILAQMDEAMKEEAKQAKPSSHGARQPETMHCRRCRTLMEDGVCPTCGFKVYVPMSEEKRKKIKTITTAIGFAVFIVIFIILQMTK